MQTDDFAQMQRDMYDHFNRMEFDEVLEHVSDDATIEVFPQMLSFSGREGFRQMMERHKEPWPDGRVEVISQMVGPEGATAECMYHATNTGPLTMPDGSSLPPTGREVHLRFCEIWRIKDGKVVSLHNFSDNMSLLAQLGLMPATEAAKV